MSSNHCVMSPTSTECIESFGPMGVEIGDDIRLRCHENNDSIGIGIVPFQWQSQQAGSVRWSANEHICIPLDEHR